MLINVRSNLAIVTLWTKKEVVAEITRKIGVLSKLHAIGTLYTTYGINYLIHTLAERPRIDTLLVFGSDLSGSGEALLKLFCKKTLPDDLDLMWPWKMIEPIVASVRAIDLRREFSERRWAALKKAVEEYYDPSQPKRAKLTLEIKERKVNGWPVPVSGHLIVDSSLFRAWIRAVYAVMQYGCVKGSEYGERQKQLLNLVVTLNMYGREYRLEREFLKYFSQTSFEEHCKSLLSPAKPEGVSYMYGERLRAHPLSGDQLEAMVKRLRRSPNTRRAVIVTWHHPVDAASTAPPCIMVIQGDITGGYYNHTCYLRSNDIYGAWPLNAYGQIMLAEYIAKKLSLKLGAITMVSCSAHIYEHDWERAWKLVHERYSVLSAFNPDPRGSFIVAMEKRGLLIEHRTPLGSLSARLELKDSASAYYSLKAIASTLTPDHAFYLGWEVRRALEKFLRKENYEQDAELRDSSKQAGSPNS